MRDATKIIRSTLTRSAPGEPLHSGPVFAAPYHTPGDPADTPYTYARSHNPTWTSLEKAIGQMESGEGYRATALVFASGMAACAAVFGAVLRPEDVVVMPSNAYYTARLLMQDYFAQMGVVLRMAPTADNAQAELLEGARLLWLESPSNPGMEICDIAMLCESSASCRSAGCRRQHDADTAGPTSAGARRGFFCRVGHEVDDRAQRSAARPCRGARSGAAGADRSVANPDRSGAGADGGVAGAAFHRDSAVAARTLVRKRASGSRSFSQRGMTLSVCCIRGCRIIRDMRLPRSRCATSGRC